jgi:hypothetical protein
MLLDTKHKYGQVTIKHQVIQSPEDMYHVANHVTQYIKTVHFLDSVHHLAF